VRIRSTEGFGRWGKPAAGPYRTRDQTTLESHDSLFDRRRRAATGVAGNARIDHRTFYSDTGREPRIDRSRGPDYPRAELLPAIDRNGIQQRG
jgi:hypothetical protein